MTFPSTPSINVAGLLSSPLVAVGITPWVANYGYTPANCQDLGALKDIGLAHEIKTANIECSNVLPIIGTMRTGEEFKFKAKLMTYDLIHMSMLTGSSSDGSDVTITDRVAGTTDGTIVWGRGSLNTDQYFTVQLHIEGLTLQYSWGGNSGVDVYTQADIIIPRCKPVIKTEQAFEKGTSWTFGFELDAVWDSTVTTPGLELFKIQLLMPKGSA